MKQRLAHWWWLNKYRLIPRAMVLLFLVAWSYIVTQ